MEGHARANASPPDRGQRRTGRADAGRRNLLRYGAGAVALLGGGFLVYRATSGDENATDEPPNEDIGPRPVSHPNVAFSFEYDGTADVLTVMHDSGDHVPADTLHVRGTGSPDLGGTWDTYDPSVAPTDDVMAGMSIQVAAVAADATVRLVWIDPAGDQSASLGEWSGPAA